MMRRSIHGHTALLAALVAMGWLLGGAGFARADVEGWLEWRGPHQNGMSDDAGLPVDLAPGGPTERWTYALRGRGTPVVIAGDRVYVLGYRGEGPDLQEVLACLDLESGKVRWERGFTDFLSDIIYERYSIGGPSVDGDTGNVYAFTSPGRLVAFDADGEPLWDRSLMEEFGRLTFPNGRTGVPAIDGDLVIVNAIISSWGPLGPARNRFYAFDKRTGELVWISTPGIGPRDSSFSTPIFAWEGRRRVFYAGTGCGNVVCVDARTGEPIWRFPMSAGGVNSSMVIAGDQIVAIHGKENLDATTTGGMAAIPRTAKPDAEGVVGRDQALWKNDLSMFTSSPTLVGDRLYQVTAHGELCAVDTVTGAVLWKETLGTSQLHASPLYAGGLLYVPMWSGDVYVVRPSAAKGEVLGKYKLEGQAIGSPSTSGGRLFVHTTEKLYCFGAKRSEAFAAASPREVQLRVVPREVVLRPGGRARFRLELIDAVGEVTEIAASESIASSVKGPLRDGLRVVRNELLAGSLVVPVAGMVTFEGPGGVTATMRVRVLPEAIAEDFAGFALDQKNAKGPFAHSPGAWLGARLKWVVRDLDGSKVLEKTLDRVLFQRTMTFMGPHDMAGYTIEADVRTAGNRRLMSNPGIICQRYIVMLDGNWQQLQIISNHDRVKVAVPFEWKANQWYRLKARMDYDGDKPRALQAKAWKVGEPEPEGWLIEAQHAGLHEQGAPGLFGFSPQIRHPVYIDNVLVTPRAVAAAKEEGR